jgi:phosphocarrier protein HPr
MTVERAVVIANRNGLHARPAAAIVKLASQFGSQITIKRDDLEVNGKSIMGVMMLAAECGATVVLKATGDDAGALVDALEELISGRFGEA